MTCSRLSEVESTNHPKCLSLPRIDELVENLGEFDFFIKMDIRWGYYNFRIKEGDEWKATFSCHLGLFEPLVMFFGLTNSPATFQSMMDTIFRVEILQGG